MTTKKDIIKILETVIDPELGIDIWTMGLIYDINIIDKESISILMTYTTPYCPLGEEIQGDIRSALSTAGFKKIDIKVTFDPPWRHPAQLKNDIIKT
ncbi:MAG: metal-sulfur cluster assembly factor [bacterium]|nr:metal-sulfur cluster assembly factor [bacterium]